MADWLQKHFQEMQVLIQQIRSVPIDSADWKLAIEKLANLILKRRKLCRSTKSEPLSPVYTKILASANQQLIKNLETAFSAGNYPKYSLQNWSQFQIEATFRDSLSEDFIEWLALETQGLEIRTAEWQRSMTELVTALKLSGKLARLPRLSRELWQDAVNQTFAWIVEHLHSFDSTRSSFLSWVNFRLNIVARTLTRENHDPLNQQIYGKTVRVQYQLRRLLNEMELSVSVTWLWLYMKGCLVDHISTWDTLLMLLILSELALTCEQAQGLGHHFLFEVVCTLLEKPHGVISTPLDLSSEIAASVEENSLLDDLRDCIQRNPCELFSKHIRSYPEATFQAIFLRRLDNQPWEMLSEQFGIKVPTLSTFFHRQLQRRLQEIHQCIEGEL